MTRLRKIASRYSIREDKLKIINEVFGVNHHIKKWYIKWHDKMLAIKHKEFGIIKPYNIMYSISWAGTPTDNPVIGSENGWLTKEMYIDFNTNNYKTFQIYIDDVVYDNNI